MKSQKQSGAGGQDAEQGRLIEAREQQTPWKKWGPYLSERQWGTVREDYSQDGNAWNYFSHDQSRSRAYRWGEDGMAGLSDDKQRLCFALALWNGRDPILKERLFGLTNSEGNHGEDVKEYYFYLDSTPTHSYMKYLYKYPQAAYPYMDLVETNRRRSRDEMEYELLDTGVFDEDRYFDVFVEYAKASRRCPDQDLDPQPRPGSGAAAPSADAVVSQYVVVGTHVPKPVLSHVEGQRIHAFHPELGDYTLHYEGAANRCSRRTNRMSRRLWGQPNASPYVKDAFHEFVIGGRKEAVNPARTGTKAAAHYRIDVPAGGAASGAPATAARRPPSQPFGDVRHDPRASGSRKPTSSTIGSRRHRSAKTSAASIVKRSPGCCGRSSTTTSISTRWLDEHNAHPLLGRAVATCGTPSGSTC